jgi:hypothetical protein
MGTGNPTGSLVLITRAVMSTGGADSMPNCFKQPERATEQMPMQKAVYRFWGDFRMVYLLRSQDHYIFLDLLLPKSIELLPF